MWFDFSILICMTDLQLHINIFTCTCAMRSFDCVCILVHKIFAHCCYNLCRLKWCYSTWKQHQTKELRSRLSINHTITVRKQGKEKQIKFDQERKSIVSNAGFYIIVWWNEKKTFWVWSVALHDFNYYT